MVTMCSTVYNSDASSISKCGWLQYAVQCIILMQAVYLSGHGSNVQCSADARSISKCGWLHCAVQCISDASSISKWAWLKYAVLCIILMQAVYPSVHGFKSKLGSGRHHQR